MRSIERSKWFTTAEMSRIMSEMDLKAAPRDAFLVRMAFYTGMRISELMNLNVGDVRGKEFVDIVGKRGVMRRVPFSKHLQQRIRTFLRHKRQENEPTHNDSPLFQSNFGQRLSEKTVQKNIKRWAILIRFPKLNNMHQFRHSILSFVANNVGVTAARDLGGHTNVSVTSVYLHTDDQMLRNAVETVQV